MLIVYPPLCYKILGGRELPASFTCVSSSTENIAGLIKVFQQIFGNEVILKEWECGGGRYRSPDAGVLVRFFF